VFNKEFPMSRITEKRDVQDQLINYLTGIGWTFIGQYELPRWRHQDEREPFSSTRCARNWRRSTAGTPVTRALMR
jgi:hypothetical protein